MTRLRESTRGLREKRAVSPSQQEAIKTHRDCDKTAPSFALAEVGGGVNIRVET